MLDGRPMTPEAAKVSVFDRGFLYGDSVFEALRTYGGRPFALDRHLARLATSAARVFIDLPVSLEQIGREVESAIVGAAIGAALVGMRPVAEMQFIDFISCAFDQIVNFAAKCRYRWGAGVPIVVRGPSGGGVHGGPFHSQNPEAYFFNVPGLKIVCPSTAYDAKGLIKAAIRDPDPVLYFEHKYLYRRIKAVFDPAGGLGPRVFSGPTADPGGAAT